MCFIKSSCANRQQYDGHVSGVQAAVGNVKQLTLDSTGYISGVDSNLGGWAGWQAIWSTLGQTPEVHFITGFLWYPETDLILFKQSFPDGLPAGTMNISSLTNSSGGDGPCSGVSSRGGSGIMREFCASHTVSSQFPTFAPTPALQSMEGGYLTWSGRFMGSQSGSDGPATGLGATSGVEGGPIVLFATSIGTNNTARPTSALVLAPFDSFKTNVFAPDAYPLSGLPALAAGTSGFVTDVPAGYSTATALWFSRGGASGVTDALHGWGTLMQRAYGTSRIAKDVSTTSLGYATDNGAAYDWYSYSNITSAGVPQDVLVALHETFTNGTYGPDFPSVSYTLIDAYWYPFSRSNGNCKINDTVWAVPFPKGLPWLAQATNATLMMYNGPMCADNTLTSWHQQSSIYWDQGWGKGVLSVVDPDSSFAYYTAMMDAWTADGLPYTFEQDFMDFQFLLFPVFQTNVSAFSTWLGGMAAASLAHGVSLQLCMALPSDMLLSLQMPAVTNARASNDYWAGGDNWRIGGSSLLLSALGLRPSKDNFWTGKAETSPHLVAAVATLSTGPVQFADFLLATDPGVLAPTCTSDGTLLQPGRPATALDGTWVPSSPWSGAGSVDARAAHTLVQPCDAGKSSLALVYSLLVAGSGVPPAAVPTTLSSEDLWPPAPIGVPMVMWAWNDTRCALGAPAETCLHPLLNSNSTSKGGRHGNEWKTFQQLKEDGDSTPWSLWTILPVWTPTSDSGTGIILMGEMGKFVSVSKYRFACVSTATPGPGSVAALSISLRGAPGESVSIGFAASDASASGQPTGAGPIQVLRVSIGVDGTAQATLQV